jgi:hypothetical protein
VLIVEFMASVVVLTQPNCEKGGRQLIIFAERSPQSRGELTKSSLMPLCKALITLLLPSAHSTLVAFI